MSSKKKKQLAKSWNVNASWTDRTLYDLEAALLVLHIEAGTADVQLICIIHISLSMNVEDELSGISC
jgi:hypothetical protein